jgi:sterol desaturase/sphingolipid hydroxylase (fatty acid hydroxylase superfamily)
VGGLDTNGYYALGVPLYLALIGLELVTTARRRMAVYGFANTIGNFSGGLGEVMIGLLVGPLLLGLYDFGYQHCALVRWPEGSIVPWVLAVVLADLCYYWNHRAGHRIALLWAIHGVHHQSETLNVSVATRHPWLSDLYAAFFYVPLPLLGVSGEKFFLAISLISFYALTVHSRVFHRPGFYVLVTPATHIVHHARNPRYIGKNLGAMFTVWDRLFGTHVEVDPSDPPDIGTPAGYQSHDGARSQWIFFRDLIALCRGAPSFRERLRVLFGPPGYRPPGVSPDRRPPARAEAEIPRGVRLYVGWQFAVVLLFALWVLWLREQHPTLLLWLAVPFVLSSLATLGRLLDGRRGAAGTELARLFVSMALVLVLAAVPGYRTAAVLLGIALAGAVLHWLAIRRTVSPCYALDR